MKKTLAFIWLLTLGMTGATLAATDVLVPLGAAWKYLDNGSDQGAAWVAPGFNDTSWNSGLAQLGYGDDDEATVVSFGGVNNNKFITTYFRHRFNVPNPGIYAVLRLRVRRDDGVVVYLNGNEVFRSNMGTGQVLFNTLAQNAGDDGNTLILGNVSPTNLVAGLNVIAAEIHQDAPNSSDISFDLELVGSTDNSAPAVALLSPGNNASFTEPGEISLRASASDPDGNLSRVEFYAGNNKLSEDNTDPYTFQWSNVPIGSYALYAVAVDALNLRTTSSVASVTVAPSTPPSIAGQNPPPGNVSSLTQITVSFSEPVSGVEAGDLLINGRPAVAVSGSGTVYQFQFAQPEDGIVRVAWEARHGIVDFETPPRPFDHYGPAANWQYNLADTLAPTAQITPAPGATLRALDRISVVFSEPVTGVDAADLRINNIPAAAMTGSGAGPYEFTFSQPLNGTINLAWIGGHGIRDFAAGQNLFAGGSWSYTLNTSASFEGQVVINEIMYHSATERDEDEWIELRNRGTNAVNLTGWRISRGVDYTFGNVNLPAGGYLVVAANLAAFNARYPGVTNVVGGWNGRLSNAGEDIEIEDATGERVDIVTYAEEGEFAIRRRWPQDVRGWEWFAEHAGLGKSLELRNPALDNNRGQNWSASTAIDGTPGAANSAAGANIPPMILEVAHFPVVPKSTNNITFTALILDEQTNGLTVNLRWRNASTASPGVFGTATMFDDGAHGDGAAGDRVYGVVLPSQTDRTIIEYYIEATDSTANTRTWPAPAQEAGGTFEQAANALLQVDNESYSGTQPIYRLIMTEADRAAFAAQTRNTDAQRNVTFVTIEAGRAEIRHNCGLRYRGAGSRGRNPPTMRLNIVGDNKWNNKSAINLNSQYTHAQVIGGQISLLTGLPSEYARAVQLRVNGSNPAGAGSPQFGSYAAVEATNGELVGEHLPDDGNGNVYRASTGNWTATLNYLGTDPLAYQQAGYSKNSNRTENDWNDLINLTFALDPATTPDNEYVAAVRRNVNVDLWIRYFAMCSLMAYTESSLANGRGDDYGLYRGLIDTRFIILPHDFDTIFNEGDTRGAVDETIYLAANRLATVNRFLRHPEFEPLYHAEFRRLLSTTFATNNLHPLLDQFLGDWVPAQTIQNMKTFITARNAAVLAQLPPEPVSIRATVAGEPATPTYLDQATLIVGGRDITHYRHRLNNGAFGPETPVGTPIVLTGLADGSYTVYVIGRNAGGIWQEETAATPSRTWTVLSNLRRVQINEVLARNVSAVSNDGGFPDVIELFNPRAVAVDLGGLRLTDDLNDPSRFVFPQGTIIPAGGYLTVFAANQGSAPGIYLGFGLDQNGESLYLLDSLANGGGILDSVTFGFQLPDLSIGRLADRSWALCAPSFGAPNTAVPTASQSGLRINEWLASGIAPLLEDFVELYNPDPLPVAVGGLYLTDLPVGRPFRHRITPLSFLSGFGYKAFIADNNPSLGADHLGFRLNDSIGELGLMRPDGTAIDAVVYGLQRDGVSQGRAPNGSPTIVFLSPPTPGAPNPVPPQPPQPVLVNLLPLNGTYQWRYEQSGTDLGTTWRAAGFDDSSWPAGPALLGLDPDLNPPEPIRTPLTVAFGKITFYFRGRFTLPANLPVSGLQVTHAIDDGAVFYINGTEAGRFNMPSGTITFSTQASTSHEASNLETLNLSIASLVPGENVIAVEVHQQGNNSSDVVFGMRLDAVILTNQVSAASIVLNEVLANNLSVTNADGSISDWVELRNSSSASVDLAGMSLTDQSNDPRRWVFPAGSVMAPNGLLVVRCDPGSPASTNADGFLNTGFGLSASGDAVYLFNRPSAGGELIDSIPFGIQAPDLSIGRFPTGSTNWVLTLPTPGSANLLAALGDATRLKINEWMADPRSGEDWFELYNPNQQPVALGGLILTDDLNDRAKNVIPRLSFMAAGLQGYLRFEADNQPELGANHVNFRLSGDGESLGIISAAGSIIDSVTFGLQLEGVSQGRLPDGSTTIVSFSETPTPGEGNFLPLPNVVINEALTHTDPPLEDAIEIHNSGTIGVDISGWYLSDSQGNPFKFLVPPGTVIPPGGHVVFYERAFNSFNPGTPFSLSSVNGDEIFLSQSSGPGALTGYRAYAQFGAAERGVSFGRHLTSVGADFTALSRRTFGQDNPSSVEEFRTGTGGTNAYPLVGPIVINEIMYRPPPLIPGSTADNDRDEFIELRNLSPVAVPLFHTNHPASTWRLRDAVDFDFPTNLTLAAGAHLLVVGFNPETNTAALDAFRSKYNIGPAVPILGPWRGRLANDSENIELYKPDEPVADGLPEAGKIPYIEVDKVKYSSAVPWPRLADGNTNGAGMSLQRRVAADYGNDPVNWIAGAPTPGAASGPAALTPPSITSITPPRSIAISSNDSLTVTAAGAAPLSYQWRFNGTEIPGATQPTLALNNFQAVNAGIYSVIVYNAAGAASASTRVDVRSLPVIVRQPSDQVSPPGGTAAFSVLAGGTPPLGYQWRRNDVNIPGANAPSYTINGVQSTDAGSYRVVITNVAGAITSSVATLSIVTPPSIVTQPAGTNVLAGRTASFSVTVTGTAPLRYQWRYNGLNIPGATNSTLTLSNLQPPSAGFYTVRVTNLIGAVISDPAELVVTPLPVVTITATDGSAGETAPNPGQFTITRSGATNLPQQIAFTVGGNATPGADYTALSSPVTIPAGSASATINVTALDDNTLEGDETVIVTLLSGSDYVLGLPASATVVIADNDNQAPTAILTSPADGTVATFPSAVALAATAADADGTVVKVEFYDNGTNKIGEDTLAPFTFTWTNASIGTHLVTAVATDNLGSTGASTPVTLLMNGRPNVTLTSPSDGAIIAPGSSITLTATATDPDGTVTLVEFYQGTNLLGSDTSSPYSIVWPSVPEGVYVLTARATDNRNTVGSSAAITITVGVPAPSFGDMFASRGVVSGYTNTVRGTNITFTREPGEPRHASRNGNHSGWVSWTAPASGLCRMDTFGSDFDTLLAVYSGNSVSNLTLVAANDDANGDTIQSALTFNAVVGTTYQIAMDGYGTNGTILLGNAGTMVLKIQLPNPYPVFQSQPQSQVVTQGTRVTFSATVTGPGPQTYQWRFNGAALQNQTNTTLVRNNVQGANSGSYVLVASNSSGSVTSAPAVLVVLTAPIITTQPQGTVAEPGSQVTLFVQASGLSPISYQWRRNGVDLPGATASNLVFLSVQGRNEGTYSVVLSNAVGVTTSQPASLSVNDGLITTTVATLIDLTNTWRYDGSGQDLGTAWRFPGYDDSGWSNGLPLFGSETTPGIYPISFLTPLNLTLSNGFSIITYYFRAPFSVPDPSAISGLFVNAFVDDGAVWYVNGREAGRVRIAGNIPADGVTASANATTQSPENQASFLLLPLTNVVAGENLLSVEVHQAGSGSSDVVFGMTLSSFTTVTNAPVLLLPQAMPDGSHQLTLNGISGRDYALDVSTNLVNWSHLVTWTNFTGSASYLEPAPEPGAGQRFYRGRVVP